MIHIRAAKRIGEVAEKFNKWRGDHSRRIRPRTIQEQLANDRANVTARAADRAAVTARFRESLSLLFVIMFLA